MAKDESTYSAVPVSCRYSCQNVHRTTRGEVIYTQFHISVVTTMSRFLLLELISLYGCVIFFICQPQARFMFRILFFLRKSCLVYFGFTSFSHIISAPVTRSAGNFSPNIHGNTPCWCVCSTLYFFHCVSVHPVQGRLLLRRSAGSFSHHIRANTPCWYVSSTVYFILFLMCLISSHVGLVRPRN